MALSRGAIEAAAPDQSALKAAASLLKPAKWPLRAALTGRRSFPFWAASFEARPSAKAYRLGR